VSVGKEEPPARGVHAISERGLAPDDLVEPAIHLRAFDVLALLEGQALDPCDGSPAVVQQPHVCLGSSVRRFAANVGPGRVGRRCEDTKFAKTARRAGQARLIPRLVDDCCGRLEAGGEQHGMQLVRGYLAGDLGRNVDLRERLELTTADLAQRPKSRSVFGARVAQALAKSFDVDDPRAAPLDVFEGRSRLRTIGVAELYDPVG
jgi:hypothetical protein